MGPHILWAYTSRAIMGPHFLLFQSIYVLYSNVTYISCIMSCEKKIVPNCCKLLQLFQLLYEESSRGVFYCQHRPALEPTLNRFTAS